MHYQYDKCMLSNKCEQHIPILCQWERAEIFASDEACQNRVRDEAIREKRHYDGACA